METTKTEPWITMSDFCQVHQLKLANFKETMLRIGLAEVAEVKCGKQERLVPSSEAMNKNIARKSGAKKSHNHSTWRWRNAYISKVFKVELKSL